MGRDFCHFANFFRLLKTWESPWRAQLKMALRGWKCFEAEDCQARCLIRLSGPCPSYDCYLIVISNWGEKKVEDWVWAVWDNSEPDREDSAAEVCFIKF